MKKLVGLIFLLTLALNFLSCEKGSIRNVDTIGYGSSFGMCAGYCNSSLTISDSKVTFVKKTNRQNPTETKTCTSTLTDTEAKSLKDLMENSKIGTLPKTIGCPDCADGGAEWVSVNSGSKEYKVVFEFGKEPQELTAIVVKLRALRETFISCN